MAGLTAEQIYDYFYNQATGTGPLTTAQSDLRQLASNYLDRAAATQRSLDKIRACWQGDASDLASQGLVPIAEALLAHGEALTTAQDGVSQQVDAWHQTRNAIQQVPPQPVPQDLVKAAGNGTLSGGALIPQGVTLMNQVKAYDAVSQANVDAYNTYSGTTDNNTGRMPPLNPLQPNTSAPLTVAAASPATPSTEHASSGSVATGHTKRSTTSQTSPAAAPAAGPAPAAPSPAAPPTVDITTTSGATAPSASAVTSPAVHRPPVSALRMTFRPMCPARSATSSAVTRPSQRSPATPVQSPVPERDPPVLPATPAPAVARAAAPVPSTNRRRRLAGWRQWPEKRPALPPHPAWWAGPARARTRTPNTSANTSTAPAPRSTRTKKPSLPM